MYLFTTFHVEIDIMISLRSIGVHENGDLRINKFMYSCGVKKVITKGINNFTSEQEGEALGPKMN